MFVLTRKIGEVIVIGGGIRVTVVEVQGGKVRLGIDAPGDVAVDDEECSLGLRCAGAPVRDHRGQVVAALSVVAPCHRLTPATLPAMVVRVRGAAQEISHRLGWSVEPGEKGGDG